MCVSFKTKHVIFWAVWFEQLLTRTQFQFQCKWDELDDYFFNSPNSLKSYNTNSKITVSFFFQEFAKNLYTLKLSENGVNNGNGKLR